MEKQINAGQAITPPEQKKPKQKKNKKKIIASVTAAALAAGILIPGTLAYLTDNETAVNTFTIGRISIETEEPHWDITDKNNNGIPDMAENTVPNQEIPKDPKVKNTGNNDAIVFMRLTVPVKDVTWIQDDGRLSSHHYPQEIFYLKTNETGEEKHDNVFNTKAWMELPSKEVNVAVPGKEAQQVGQRTYVFAYRKRLPKTTTTTPSETEPLFDKVQIKNILENEVSSDQMNRIKVETWAIQADNIEGDGVHGFEKGKTIDTKNDLNEQKLNYIYDVFINQNGQVDDHGNMKYSTYQDPEHGSVEKESSTSGTTDINGKLVHSKLRATVESSYLVPESTNKANASEGYLYSGYPSTTQMSVSFLEKSAKLNDETMAFESSRPDVATVDTKGKITAVNEGTTTIKATAKDGAYVTISIHVVKDARTVAGHVSANDEDNSPEPSAKTPQQQ